jgi:hypothetical protein
VKNPIWTAIGKSIMKLLSIVLATAFSISLCGTILIHTFLTTFSDLANFEAIFESTRLVDRSQGLIVRYIISPALREGNDQQYAYLDLLRDIPLETWEKIASSILPHEWVEENIRVVVQAILGWIKTDETDLPNITLELGQLIQVLDSPKGSLAILPIIQQLPACPPGYKPSTANTPAIAPCLSEEFNIVMMANTTAEVAANSLPDRVTTSSLEGMGLIDPVIISSIRKIHTGLHLAESTKIFGGRLSLLFLALYALMNSGSLRSLARTLPLPVFLSGICLILFIGAGYGFLQFEGAALTLGLSRDLDIQIQALLADIVRDSGYLFLRHLIAWGVLLLMAGLILSIAIIGIERWKNFRAVRRNSGKKQPVRIRKQFR